MRSLLCFFLLGFISWSNIYSAPAQVPTALPVKQQIYVGETKDSIGFAIPKNWQFDGSVLQDARDKKVGEFFGFEHCQHQNGAAFIRALKAGDPDDQGDTRYVGSSVLTLGSRQWTEGVQNIPLWDGINNNKRWYKHTFFSHIQGKCLTVAFYSFSRQLPQEATYRSILASIKPL